MEKTKKTGTLVECSVLIAMAFVLSFIKIIDMPYGGAVTAASMLPIIIAGYRNGLKWGLITSFTYSILQLLTGLSNCFLCYINNSYDCHNSFRLHCGFYSAWFTWCC